MVSINKKIRNATVNKQGNITFKSILEKTCFNTLIEADGKQHFELRFGQEEDFQIRKKHDKIKDEYCKLNNIKLIDENRYLLRFVK